MIAAISPPFARLPYLPRRMPGRRLARPLFASPFADRCDTVIQSLNERVFCYFHWRLFRYSALSALAENCRSVCYDNVSHHFAVEHGYPENRTKFEREN